MIRWPIIDREPVQLPTLAGYEFALWETLLELADLRPQEWTLIGGQMVFVHAIERGVEPLRVSSDLDVLVNARIVTGGVRQFVRAIQSRGFVLAGWSPEGLAHRYCRGRVSLDVLAPDGLGLRRVLNNDDCSGLPPADRGNHADEWQAAGGLLSTLLEQTSPLLRPVTPCRFPEAPRQ